MGKNVQVHVYLSTVEADVWRSEAEARRISLAEFIRQCVTRSMNAGTPEYEREDAAHEAAKADLLRRISRGEAQLTALGESLEVTKAIKKTADEATRTYGPAASKLRREAGGHMTPAQSLLADEWEANARRSASVEESYGKRELVVQGRIRALEADLLKLYTEGLDYKIPPHPRYTVVTDPPIVPFVDASSAIAPPAWHDAPPSAPVAPSATPAEPTWQRAAKGV